MFTLYKFFSRGVGVVSTTTITKGTLIGYYYSKNIIPSEKNRLLFNGWVETYPLGRFLNHSIDCNLNLILDKDVVMIYSAELIHPGIELTVNYIQAVDLIKLPDHLIIKYGIKNFGYEEEIIDLNKPLI